MHKVRFFFLFLISILFFYSVFFTEYAPDMYVFVKYALLDFKANSITIDSFLNNNFVFDSLAIIGFLLGLDNVFGFLSLISFFSYLLFLLKYYYLSGRGSFLSIVLVFIGSFLTFDINVFRFNLAIFFLLLIYFLKNKIYKVISIMFSFSSHIFPLLFLISKRLYFIPIFIIYLIISLLPETRLNLYLDNNDFKFFKSFILIIPSLSCLLEVSTKNIYYFDNKTVFRAYKELSVTFLIIGLFLMFVNSVIASRLIETVFYFSIIFNVFYNFSRFNYFLLYFFACWKSIIFFSRYLLSR
jgi:hypothetical protein